MTRGGRGARERPPAARPRRRPMTSYIIRRLLLILPTVFLALSFLFFLFFTLPGDPARLIAGGANRNIDPGVIDRVSERYGLDEPLLVQFKDYWSRTIHWDLGESFLTRRSVNDILGEKAVASIRLAIWAIIIEIVVGIPRGDALRHTALFDRRSRHHDPHRRRVRDTRLRPGFRAAVAVRGPAQQVGLARVGTSPHAGHRARLVGAVLHSHGGSVALSDPAGRSPSPACLRRWRRA